MKYYYIGGFPSPYGGVTIKNQTTYDELVKHISIEKVDLNRIKRFKLRELFKLIFALCGHNSMVLGVAGIKTRRRFTHLFYCINYKAFCRSILIVMGGQFADTIVSDAKYRNWVSQYKMIYVETEEMRNKLEHVGVKNVKVFPNCRVNPKIAINRKRKEETKMRCLYFSLISREKGANIVLETAEKKKNINFDFYGHIADDYYDEFYSKTEIIDNVNYCGVFSGSDEEKYVLLSRYDILLFPTHWVGEGVPGVLIEAKFAALPAIVSDWAYNSSIIHDGIDGFVLANCDSDNLASAIESYENDSNILKRHSINSKQDSENYNIEKYIVQMINQIE